MANHEINEEQEAVNKALRMIETSDPVHADVYNALFSVLINNDVFLEKLANKMVQQVMISHVMDSTNKDMVMGADQGPVITQLIEKVQEKVDVLNTNSLKASTFNARPEAKYYGYSIPFTTAATTIGDICDILGARNGYIMLDTAAPINPMQGYYTIVELRAYNAVIIATAKSRIGIWGGQATNTTWSGWTKL